MTHLSVVSPVYKAEGIIPILVERIEKSVSKITDDYEIILVEDCGPDDSWKVIEKLARTNPKIKGIKLSRNFGQHYAITAGLDKATGEWTVLMDCDLQDQPEEIIKLYNKAQEGYDVVLARRFNRKDSSLKKFYSTFFYKTLSSLTGSKLDATIANFGIYHQNVIAAIISMRESIRYFPTMVQWVGFNTTTLNVVHDFRLNGKTSYSLKKKINLALDIILAYSDKPIRLLIKFGLIVSILSLILAAKTIIDFWEGEIIVLGYTSLIISVWFLSGIIISTLGLIGLYVGKTFEGVKKRPIYIIDKTTDDNKT